MPAQDSHRLGRRGSAPTDGVGFAHARPKRIQAGMIHEHALLHIRLGQSAAFEAAFQRARPLIAASPGFVSITVQPASETPDLYLLVVGWTDIAAHRDGFRQSDRYREWRALLHSFYDPVPTITYFGPSII